MDPIWFRPHRHAAEPSVRPLRRLHLVVAVAGVLVLAGLLAGVVLVG